MYMNMLYILKMVFYSVGKMYWLKIMVIVKVELTFVEDKPGWLLEYQYDMRCCNCINVKTKILKIPWVVKILRTDVGGKRKSHRIYKEILIKMVT